MKTYTVVFTPEAEESLVSIYEYIAGHGSPNVAARYTDAIVSHCERLATFPHRGTRAMTCDRGFDSPTTSAGP